MSGLAIADIEQLFRREYGRSVAVLIRLCGNIDAAEEAVQDAFAEAVQRWPSTGLPPSPAGWIIKLCDEGIRLGRVLLALMPEEPEVMGLLALMLLIDSRREARLGPDGNLVLLPDQNRALWNRSLIAEGQILLQQCLVRNEPGPYQLQAAINAVHSSAPTQDAVDWHQILRLYDHLQSLQPTPVVALNRAVALAEVAGPGAALSVLDELDLQTFYLFHAIRADLLSRLGRRDEAADAYDQAIARMDNAKERELLLKRRLTLARGVA